MCGLYFYASKDELNYKEISDRFYRIKYRGPDQSVTENFLWNDLNIFLGFHRLAIIDINNGKQPFFSDGIYLICNGEIFNHHELVKKYDLKLKTHSDCEVILHLYRKFGESFVNMLDGDFAFILFDSKKGELHFARDMIGVRPLFMDRNLNYVELASELKALKSDRAVEVSPGYYYKYNFYTGSLHSKVYKSIISTTKKEIQIIMPELRKIFTESVKKRLESERDIGFLLSGGLDSSLVLSVACELLPEKQFHAFSIGSQDDISPDIENAKTVVNYLNYKYNLKMKGKPKVIHHIVHFDYKKAIENIEELVYTIETFDITTIRASTPMWWLCKYIRDNTDIKVLFSGEGSDELFGGYLYFYYAPNGRELEKETEKLVNELHMYDVCRADRSVSSNGLELRVPFLDKEFVKYVLNIDGEIRRPIKDFKMEKWILRKSFEGFLPESILYLQKAAFSDNAGYGWKDAIKKYCEHKLKSKDVGKLINKPFSDNPEEIYHRYIFQKYFGSHIGIISHLWLPNKEWVDTGSEPSARVLEVHKK
jgi:asparagine synthase (glutamine-hydrolysing)